MTQYTVTLSNAETIALGYVSAHPQDWINNAVHNRCRIAIDEIVAITVQKCLDANIQIPGSKDAIVELAFERGWVLTAEERNNQQSQTSLD
jgi:hypothetical protein